MKPDLKRIALVALLMAAAAVVGGSFPVSDSHAQEGGVVYERSHDFFFSYYSVKYPAAVNVSAPAAGLANLSVGFSTDTTMLDFGLAASGESVHRKFMNISNPEDSRVRICVRKAGSISPMLNLSDSCFVLEPGEMKAVSLTLDPAGYAPGRYAGQVEIAYKKPAFWISDMFL